MSFANVKPSIHAHHLCNVFKIVIRSFKEELLKTSRYIIKSQNPDSENAYCHSFQNILSFSAVHENLQIKKIQILTSYTGRESDLSREELMVLETRGSSEKMATWTFKR
jgi:hypothetical protein